MGKIKWENVRKRSKKTKDKLGMHVERTLNSILKEKKRNEVSQDTENRKYVVDTIIEYIKDGKNINEAIELIMEDDIIKEFEYLTKNGLDLRSVFYNWVNRYVHVKEEKEGLDR